MTAVAWGSPQQGGANVLVGAALDGTLSMWSGDGPYSRPAAEIRNAHTADTWTSGLDISADGRLVVTRGGDDTIKLWDTRKFKTPVNTTSHISTSSQFPTSNIRFASNSTSVITGSETGPLHTPTPSTPPRNRLEKFPYADSSASFPLSLCPQKTLKTQPDYRRWLHRQHFL